MRHKRPRRAARNGARFTIETDHGLQRPYAVIDSRTGEQVGGRFASRAHAEELRDAENSSVRSRSAPQHAYLPNGTRAQRIARIKRDIKAMVYGRGRSSLRNCGCGGRSSVPNDAGAALASISDTELIARMIAADNRAWKEFTRRYDRVVFDAVMRVFKPFSSKVVSDLPSEARANFYAKLLANDMKVLRSFDPSRGVKFSSWMYNVVKTTTYDLLRSTKRSALASTKTVDDWEANAVSEFGSAEARYLGREELRGLAARVAKLPERDQRLFQLSFVEGLEPQEVADDLGMTTNAVYTRRHRIKNELGLE